MAKLKAPLLSLGASGAIGKAIVYFPWKGLDVAREYVVPANPKSQAQIDQRAFMTAAVTAIHDAMAAALHPLTSVDKSAYSLYASAQGITMTWFNTAVKNMVDAQVDGQDFACFATLLCTYLAATTSTVSGYDFNDAAGTGFVKYGTSKTALLSSVAADRAANYFTATLTGLVVGTTYYWQWQATPVAGKNVLKSGIYVYKHEAP